MELEVPMSPRLAALALWLTWLPLSPALALEVGVAPATRKVLPDTPFPTETAAYLRAARNEWEGVQLVVRGDGPLTGLDVTAGALQHCQIDATLPADGIRLYREVFLDIEQPSPISVTYHERVAGRYPDPLVPLRDPHDPGAPAGAPFDLDEGEVAVVFVDVYVPADAEPALYQGTLTVTADGEEAVAVPLSVTVWPFELPASRSMATSYGFSDNQIRKFHGGPDGDPPDGYQEIVDRYIEELHVHRIDRTNVGGSLDFEFDDEGALLPVDWSEYDAAVGPYLDGSRFADGVGVNRFNVGRFRPGAGLGSWTEDQYAQAAAAFAEHLDDNGWWDHAYVYSTDEPWLNGGEATYEQIHEDAQRLFAASELWRGHILVTSAYYPTVDGDIGIWCPVTPMFADYFYPEGWYEDAAFYSARPDEELWFYACNANLPPYAGYDIDAAIGYEPRIVKWGAWMEGASGFLYWRTNYWVADDPWNEWANWDYFGPLFSRNGDGFLLYPGDHDGSAGGLGSPADVALDGPIPSYRLKQVRDGMEDWELFALCTDLGGGDYAREQVGRAYVRFGDSFVEGCGDDPNTYCPDDQPWTLDEELLTEVRENIAAKVMHLLYPEEFPDPEGAGDDDDSAADDDCAEGDDDDSVGKGAGGCQCRDTPGHPGSLAALALLCVVLSTRRRSRQ
jgi:hypothetical protein